MQPYHGTISQTACHHPSYITLTPDKLILALSFIHVFVGLIDDLGSVYPYVRKRQESDRLMNHCSSHLSLQRGGSKVPINGVSVWSLTRKTVGPPHAIRDLWKKFKKKSPIHDIRWADTDLTPYRGNLFSLAVHNILIFELLHRFISPSIDIINCTNQFSLSSVVSPTFISKLLYSTTLHFQVTSKVTLHSNCTPKSHKIGCLIIMFAKMLS